MNHKNYKEWLQLSLYDELEEQERSALHEHLGGCVDCRDELEQLKRLHAQLTRHPRLTMSHQLLTDARRRLRVALQEEVSRPPLWERFIEPVYKISFSGVIALGIGFVVGYVTSSAPGYLSGVEGQVPLLDEDTYVSNVRFVDPDATDREIEFTFDVVRTVRMKGNLNDPQVQKVLAHALVNSQNPGVRLRTIGALSGQTDPLHSTPIREALLGAATSDGNPAIRKEALTLLEKLPYDNEIKDAILYILQNDENSGVRIAAITGLERFKNESVLKDREIQNALRERIKSDDNNFVRLVARNYLEENK